MTHSGQKRVFSGRKVFRGKLQDARCVMTNGYQTTPQRIRTSNLRFRSRLRIAGVNVVERLDAVRFTNMNIVLANRCRLSHFYAVSSGNYGLKW